MGALQRNWAQLNCVFQEGTVGVVKRSGLWFTFASWFLEDSVHIG